MEEIIPLLQKKIQEKIHVEEDEDNLSIGIVISGKHFGKLAYPGEIEKMLIMLGGLRSKVPMHISVNEKDQKINLRVENLSDYLLIQTAIKKIWDNAIYMFSEILKGNFDVIKDIPSMDE
jgi:hypothetical protein